MILITSINQALYHEYGKRMMEGWQANSRGVKLFIVFEGSLPQELREQKFETIKILKLKGQDLDRFHNTFGKLYEANGIRLKETTFPNGERRIEIGNDYRFNFVRFSFKIFSILIARKEIGASTPFSWIDADLKCLAPFDANDLTQFMPKSDQIMSYLGRTNFPTKEEPYSECGFLGFNPEHEQTSNFLERMKSLYMTGEGFRFKQWHDSWLWDEVRKEFEARGFKFRNISGKYKNTHHPFINCGLGKFFDHLKGPERKKIGHSFDRDIVRE